MSMEGPIEETLRTHETANKRLSDRRLVALAVVVADKVARANLERDRKVSIEIRKIKKFNGVYIRRRWCIR